MGLTEKILVVKIWGGLGNQMFQYAAARALTIENNAALLVDTSTFVKNTIHETPRNYRLNVFPNIGLEIVDSKIVDKIVPKFKVGFLNKLYKIFNRNIRLNKRHKIENGLIYSKITMNTDILYLDGYWQSEKYFLSNADSIRNDFDLSYLNTNPVLESIIEKITSRESISIHVRRGDYVTNASANAHHGTCDLDYYYRAINKLVEKIPIDVSFFIFSDDVSWCKENLRISSEHFYVETKEDYHDLYLMSICKHNIIANSSFSWWGAWLNDNASKNIIAPKKWFATDATTDLIPENWIKI